MNKLALLAAFVFSIALSCGRSELDWVGPDAPSTGAAGTSGAAGTAGAAGTRGAAGTSGAAGTRGAAGTFGAAGTIGAAGQPGTAGTFGAGGTGPITRIPCGTTTCTAAAQQCCVNLMTNQTTCLPANQPCPTGPSISCLDTLACGPGRACCVHPNPPSSTCDQPLSCVASAGLILCSSESDCPPPFRNCCGAAGFKVCSLQTCPAGSGGGASP